MLHAANVLINRNQYAILAESNAACHCARRRSGRNTTRSTKVSMVSVSRLAGRHISDKSYSELGSIQHAIRRRG